MSDEEYSMYNPAAQIRKIEALEAENKRLRASIKSCRRIQPGPCDVHEGPHECDCGATWGEKVKVTCKK